MDLKPLPIAQLQNIVEEYVDVDLLELAHDLFETLPIYTGYFCIKPEYLNEFMELFDSMVSLTSDNEDFIKVFAENYFNTFMQVHHFPFGSLTYYINKAESIIKNYADTHKIEY